jgi:4-hydroxy-3-polyprenylbenzoate decarboxylase
MLNTFSNYENAKNEIHNLSVWINNNIKDFEGIVQIVIYDDFNFKNETLRMNDYVWITYTRSNPSHDIFGVNEFIENKHWACNGPMIVDARKKPHHAPELVKDINTEYSVHRFFKEGGPLHQWK